MSTPSKGVALVTGASRGIGRAVCLRLARDGYEIIAVARDAAHLEVLVADVTKAKGKCRALRLDLTDAARIDAALHGLHVDVVVNNAGIGVIKPLVELTVPEWDRMINLNVNALFHVTRAVLPGMLERGRGHVCTIGSIGGRSAYAGGSCYNATKAFVTAWAESLMLEVRDHGIKVSVVSPGGVATEFGGRSPTQADNWKLRAEDVADTVSYVLGTPPGVLVHRAEVRTLRSPPAKK